jgi:hypothetical protein
VADQSTTPTEVQPQGDGLGDGNNGSLPWDLSSAPEELRPFLEQELKKVEGGITKRFQEASEFRKQMEPLQGLAELEGITDVPKEELSALLEFRQMAQDPAQFEEWWSQVGEELGFFAGGGDDDEDDGGAGDEPPEWAQTLMQRLDAVEGRTQEQQNEQRESAALQKIEADLGSLREKHADVFGENSQEVEDAICQLAMAYEDEDAIQKGFQDYMRLTGRAQSALVDGAQRQPSLSLTGGQGDSSDPQIKNFSDAKEAAKARFSGAR